MYALGLEPKATELNEKNIVNQRNVLDYLLRHFGAKNE